MAQGKFKANKKVGVEMKKKPKQDAFHRRHNAPIKPRKSKHTESQKLKSIISKDLNKNVESEIRSRAVDGIVNLSKAQEAVKSQYKKAEMAIAAKQAPSSSNQFP